MANINLDVRMFMRVIFEHQVNGDIWEVPRALVMLGHATAMVASACEHKAPPRMLVGHEQAYLIILSVVRVLGLATTWAGLWVYLNPRVRGAVGKKMLRAAFVVLLIAIVGLNVEVNLNF